MYDVAVVGGRTPTGPKGSLEPRDVAIADGTIAAIEPELGGAAATTIDATGCLVLPGLVDPHVHVSGYFGRAVGLRMLARAGVTAALDLAGDPRELCSSLATQGCGLTVGVLFPLVPGETVESEDPSEARIEEILDEQLERGALGLKVLGGHYPLTPEATAAVIAVCARRSAYCAVHAGTTATGSDVAGLEELVDLASGQDVHVAHVNSYCRGQIEHPVDEAARALAALRRGRRLWSDSYLAVVNGADGRCADGVPRSGVVRTCLRIGGYPETRTGLEQAIRDGFGRVQVDDGEENRFVEPAAGLELFRHRDTAVGVSFPVNPPAAILPLALARTASGEFAIPAFGSDGGSIPRNTTLPQAHALAAGGFLTLEELVQKAATAPADRLGLARKGRLEAGADGDVIVVDGRGGCRDSVIGGKVVVREGEILELAGGTLLRAVGARC